MQINFSILSTQALDCSCYVTQTSKATGDVANEEATGSEARTEKVDKKQQEPSSEPKGSSSGTDATGGTEGTAASGPLQPVQEVAVMQLSTDLSSRPPPTAQVLLHATQELLSCDFWIRCPHFCKKKMIPHVKSIRGRG